MVVDHLVLSRDRRLLAADRRLMDLSEAMFGVGHWRYDVRTAQFDWSDELYRIYGQTPEAFDPNVDSPLQFHSPSDRERLVALLKSAIAGKSGYECQVSIYRSDGVVREVTTKAVCELNPLGEVVGVLGVSQDVTDREAHLREARKSQLEYRLLADHVDDVISRLRMDGTCEYLSREEPTRPWLYVLVHGPRSDHPTRPQPRARVGLGRRRET
jgi:PAS domain S-box-containing protein